MKYFNNNDLIQAFYDDRNIAEHARTVYKTVIKRFSTFLDSRNLDEKDVTKALCEEFLYEYLTSMSMNSRNSNYRTNLITIYDYLIEKELIVLDENPFRLCEIRREKKLFSNEAREKRKMKYVIDSDDYNRLCDLICSIESLRDKSICMLSYETGFDSVQVGTSKLSELINNSDLSDELRKTLEEYKRSNTCGEDYFTAERWNEDRTRKNFISTTRIQHILTKYSKEFDIRFNARMLKASLKYYNSKDGDHNENDGKTKDE